LLASIVSKIHNGYTRVKGCAAVVIPDALTIRYTDWIKPLKTAKVLLRVKW